MCDRMVLTLSCDNWDINCGGKLIDTDSLLILKTIRHYPLLDSAYNNMQLFPKWHSDSYKSFFNVIAKDAKRGHAGQSGAYILSAIISWLGCGDLWRNRVGVKVGEAGKEVGDQAHQNRVEGRFAGEIPGVNPTSPNIGVYEDKKVAVTHPKRR